MSSALASANPGITEMNLSKPQFKALWAAFTKGGAVYNGTRRMGGGFRRMVDRMAEQNLLSEYPPFPITIKGLRSLHAACEARYRKDACMAYLDDLRAVEKALGSLAKRTSAGGEDAIV
jgi:hypothetical protein